MQVYGSCSSELVSSFHQSRTFFGHLASPHQIPLFHQAYWIVSRFDAMRCTVPVSAKHRSLIWSYKGLSASSGVLAYRAIPASRFSTLCTEQYSTVSCCIVLRSQLWVGQMMIRRGTPPCSRSVIMPAIKPPGLPTRKRLFLEKATERNLSGLLSVFPWQARETWQPDQQSFFYFVSEINLSAETEFFERVLAFSLSPIVLPSTDIVPPLPPPVEPDTGRTNDRPGTLSLVDRAASSAERNERRACSRQHARQGALRTISAPSICSTQVDAFRRSEDISPSPNRFCPRVAELPQPKAFPSPLLRLTILMSWHFDLCSFSGLCRLFLLCFDNG